MKIEFNMSLMDAVRLYDALDAVEIDDTAKNHLVRFVAAMVKKQIDAIEAAPADNNNYTTPPCADCGSAGMGDAVYDPMVPDTDGRCQTCGML